MTESLVLTGSTDNTFTGFSWTAIALSEPITAGYEYSVTLPGNPGPYVTFFADDLPASGSLGFKTQPVGNGRYSHDSLHIRRNADASKLDMTTPSS